MSEIEKLLWQTLGKFWQEGKEVTIYPLARVLYQNFSILEKDSVALIKQLLVQKYLELSSVLTLKPGPRFNDKNKYVVYNWQEPEKVISNYLVLDLTNDPLAIIALQAYVQACQTHNPTLSP